VVRQHLSISIFFFFFFFTSNVIIDYCCTILPSRPTMYPPSTTEIRLGGEESGHRIYSHRSWVGWCVRWRPMNLSILALLAVPCPAGLLRVKKETIHSPAAISLHFSTPSTLSLSLSLESPTISQSESSLLWVFHCPPHLFLTMYALSLPHLIESPSQTDSIVGVGASRALSIL
jgi:hypothetical protein